MADAQKLVLGIDVGGTKVLAGVVDERWKVVGRGKVKSPFRGGPAEMTEALVSASDAALAEAGASRNEIAAIGLGVPGPLDAERTTLLRAMNLGVERWEIPSALEPAVPAMPKRLENDVRAAALGEARLGAGQGASSVFYVTVSTGVGGGWVLDSKIYGGADGMAGEIGHTVVDPAGPLCICGRHGCVEVMACGPAIARAARERLTAEPDAGAILRSLITNDLNAVTGERVARAAEAGDALAQQVMDRAAYALGFGIGTAITLMNPERVVVGGGVSKSGERWLAGVRAAARANSLPQIRVEIVPAALKDDAPLWGAIALADQVLSG